MKRAGQVSLERRGIPTEESFSQEKKISYEGHFVLVKSNTR
jgi:hypothetical protein